MQPRFFCHDNGMKAVSLVRHGQKWTARAGGPGPIGVGASPAEALADFERAWEDLEQRLGPETFDDILALTGRSLPSRQPSFAARAAMIFVAVALAMVPVSYGLSYGLRSASMWIKHDLARSLQPHIDHAATAPDGFLATDEGLTLKKALINTFHGLKSTLSEPDRTSRMNDQVTWLPW